MRSVLFSLATVLMSRADDVKNCDNINVYQVGLAAVHEWPRTSPRGRRFRISTSEGLFEQSASGIPGTIADLRWFGKELDVILVLTEKSELMRSTDDGKTFQSVRCAEAQ